MLAVAHPIQPFGDSHGALAPELAGVHIAQERSENDLLALSWPSMARAGVYAFICVTIVTVGLKPIPFIYFQF